METDNLYGIPISKITDDQLRYMNLGDLYRFMQHDDRIEDIFLSRLKKCNKYDIVSQLSSLYIPINNCKKINKFYNDFIRENSLFIDNQLSKFQRSNLIRFVWLDDDLKINEISRKIHGLHSVARFSVIDFTFLYNKSKSLARDVGYFILKPSNCLADRSYFIKNMPTPMMDEFFPIILSGPKKYSFFILSNRNAPYEYKVEALRKISRRKYNIPPINVALGKDVWRGLSPITRLNVLESILYYAPNKMHLDFDDIRSEEDLKEVLFSTLLKYHNRVEKLIKTFKRNYERK